MIACYLYHICPLYILNFVLNYYAKACLIRCKYRNLRQKTRTTTHKKAEVLPLLGVGNKLNYVIC